MSKRIKYYLYVIIVFIILFSIGSELKKNYVMAYTSKFSYLQGEIIELFIASKRWGQPIREVIFIDALSNAVVYRNKNSIYAPKEKCESYKDRGCNFGAKINIDSRDLQPGYYTVKIKSKLFYTLASIYVNIQPASEFDKYDFAIIVPLFTWHAYNDTGGRSFYTKISEERNENDLRTVSVLRSFSNNKGVRPDVPIYFLKKLKEIGYSAYIIDSLDVHNGSKIFTKAKNYIIIDHDEYWTFEMRLNIEGELKKNKNLVIFGGNTCWWKIDYQNNLLMHYRNSPDPREDISIKTGKFYKIPWPEESTIGLSFRFGGYPVHRQIKNIDEAMRKGIPSEVFYKLSEGMIVSDSFHPIYDGLSFNNGDIFGDNVPLMWGEIDGAPLHEGELDFTNYKGPKNIKVIATGYTYRGKLNHSATIVEFKFYGKGTVVNLGSIGWWRGLQAKDNIIEQIFSNTIKYIASINK